MPADFIRQIASECLAARIRIVNRVVTSIFDRRLRDYGLRSSQINILIVVAANDHISPTEACRLLCLEKSTLSRDLSRLVEHGWIVVSQESGRGQRLEITTEGRALLRKLKPAWRKAQAEAREALGDTLADELCRIVNDGKLKRTAKA